MMAILLLALDVAEDEADGAVPDWALPSGFLHPLVNASVPLGNDREAEFAWPLPEWLAPSEANIMTSALTWSNLSKDLSSNDPGTLARRFVSAILSAQVRQQPPEQIPDSKTLWGTLAAQIAEALVRRASGKRADSIRVRTIDQWLCERAGLLAAPESGLPPETANELLGALFSCIPDALHSELVSSLKSGRETRAAQAISEFELNQGENVSTILSRIDEARPSFEWLLRVENRASASQDLVEALQASLERIPIHHQPESSAKTPETLNKYAQTTDGEPIQSLRRQPRQRLKDVITSIDQLASEAAPASQAIFTLWKALLENSSESERTQLESMIKRTETGLRVFLPPELDSLLSDPAMLRTTVSHEFEMWYKITWQFHLVSSINLRANPLYRFLMLAHDIAADEWDVTSAAMAVPSGSVLPSQSITWGAALPDASGTYLFRGKQVRIDLPVPKWLTFLDWRLTEKLWAACKPKSLTSTISKRDCSPAVRQFLGRMSAVAHGRQVSSATPLGWEQALQWILMSPQQTDLKGARWTRVREWAEIGIVLFATPELGLSEDDCIEILKLLTSSDSAKMSQIVAARRAWVGRSLRLAGLDHDDVAVARFLKELDDLNKGHPWHNFIGADAMHPREFSPIE
jgi:hypothetical protein